MIRRGFRVNGLFIRLQLDDHYAKIIVGGHETREVPPLPPGLLEGRPPQGQVGHQEHWHNWGWVRLAGEGQDPAEPRPTVEEAIELAIAQYREAFALDGHESDREQEIDTLLAEMNVEVVQEFR